MPERFAATMVSVLRFERDLPSRRAPAQMIADLIIAKCTWRRWTSSPTAGRRPDWWGESGEIGDFSTAVTHAQSEFGSVVTATTFDDPNAGASGSPVFRVRSRPENSVSGGAPRGASPREAALLAALNCSTGKSIPQGGGY